MLPDWVWSVVAMMGIGLVGWILSTQVTTGNRLASIEAELEHHSQRLDIVSDKIVPLLEAR